MKIKLKTLFAIGLILKVIKYLGIIILVYFSTSCSNNGVIEQQFTIPQSGWHKDTVVTFTCNIEDNSDSYNISLEIEHSNYYLNNNIWLFIGTLSPAGILQKDTLNIILAENSGKWYGKLSGDNVKIRVPFKQAVGFPENGEYKFFIQQGLRTDVLTTVNKIGILIEPYDN